jgi:hypothetical protein
MNRITSESKMTKSKKLGPRIIPAIISPTTIGTCRLVFLESKIGTRKAANKTNIKEMKLVS